ncbi:SDR family oxidoreductase [Weeksellaceae bacterium KMM 9713]|uniref:SDR family oxidoreductase n=1 Tax=Profundicola chukchiensis TaxID=2961959 RepID=A0A9X4RUJ6_9FLAO|nr:SDR family oxidoreductase [Profundicola chukchiensis]MDG4946213.1 SDR family oxidoreductase [Profundicola chukchiensis]
MERKQKVLVAGANGTTGKIIVELLKDSAIYEPIAMLRKEEQEKAFKEQNIKVVLADLEEDLTHTTEGIDKVIFAAGSKGKNVVGVDQKGAKRLIDASKQAKVSKFVMLSSMGADNPSIGGELEDYLKAKQNADDYLKSSNLDYVIVRPGNLTNDEAKGKIALGSNLSLEGKISRADVAKTLVEALDDKVRTNQVFEILEGENKIEEIIRA